jgi:hypothetical protein
MSRTRTLWRSVIVLGTAGVSAFALASPAQALVPPDWPAAGFLPTGCTLVVPSGPDLAFTDWTVPQLRSLTWLRNGVPVGSDLVLGPSPVSGIGIGGRVTSGCSGSGMATSPTVRTGGTLWLRMTTASPPQALALTRSTTTSAWDTVWYAPSPGPVTLEGAGYSLSAFMWVSAARYGTFTLDYSGRLVGSAAPPPLAYVIPTVAQKLRVLRATTTSLATSATSVPRGRSVRATAAVRVAVTGRYVGTSGLRVVLQRRYGTNAWRTVASALTNRSGAAAFSVPVVRTAAFRAVLAPGTLAAMLAPSASAVKVVRVR